MRLVGDAGRSAALLVGLAMALSACSDAQAPAKNPSAPNSVAAAPSTPTAPAAAAPTKWDGPLGLKMGLTRKELEAAIALNNVTDFSATSETSPSPHDAFSAYGYRFSPDTGLCVVLAISPDIQTNSFGQQIRSDFDSLSAALTEKYGKPTDSFDFLMHGSIWKDADDWVMGLLKKERTLAKYWVNGKKNTNLPNDLATIGLVASAESSSSGSVKLTYEFKNVDPCLAASESARNKPL